jgi:hypothetical protein
MAWSFKRRIKIIPGIHLNFSKSGISTSIGVKGARLSIGPKGTFINTSIPGTGISHHQKISSPSFTEPEVIDEFSSDFSSVIPAIDNNIFSADILEITSMDMQGIKETILLAHNQREELKKDLLSVKNDLKAFKKKQLISYIFLYGFALKKYRLSIKESLSSQELAITALQNQINNGYVQLDINFDPELQHKFEQLQKSYEQLIKSKKIWDITASYSMDQFVTRSAAATEVFRREVSFTTGHLPEIKSSIPAMIWHNANGADLYFFPNFVIAWNNRESFAIVGIDELDITFSPQRFIEDETVPYDSKIIDKTWYKVNKNGSPDKRFKDNYQLPIVQYGNFEIKTKTGLNERYMVSNHEAAELFVKLFFEYQIEVIKLVYVPSIS